MGIACCSETDKDALNIGDRDLPAPSTLGVKDQYKLFELSLPFARTEISSFIKKVDDAE